jgi:hypothetical protein
MGAQSENPPVEGPGDSVPEYEAILRMVANAPRKFPIPHKVGRKNLEQAFLTSFELIGGVPRLAMWADQNPTEFYRLITKLFPQHMEAKVGVNDTLAAILMRMGRSPQTHEGSVTDAELLPSPEAPALSAPAVDTMVHTREHSHAQDHSSVATRGPVPSSVEAE